MSEAGVEFAEVSFAPASQRPGEAPRQILKGISLALDPGTTTALLGRSGSGKTTLMRTVNGMVMPTGGAVRVLGKATNEWNLLELRRKTGYVIQETGLFPHWTVGRNAGLALELAGKPDAKRVDEALRMAGLDFALKDRYPWQLSGGQRQRVGLARALAAEPEILLMDEPFGALDPMTRAEMQDMVKGLLAKVAKTVLLVTHDLDEALFLAHRVIFLEDGAVVADLPAREVMKSDNEHVKKYVASVHRGIPA